MNRFKNNLTFYILQALMESGVHIEGDMHVELSEAFDDLADDLKRMSDRIDELTDYLAVNAEAVARAEAAEGELVDLRESLLGRFGLDAADRERLDGFEDVTIKSLVDALLAQGGGDGQE